MPRPAKPTGWIIFDPKKTFFAQIFPPKFCAQEYFLGHNNGFLLFQGIPKYPTS